MLKLTRFAQLKVHRVFHDFTWPRTLADFAKFNLIYGWNGSGKTTLSSLFRAIEQGVAVTEGDVQLILNGAIVRGTEIPAHPALPKVKVFNPDFVKESVFKTGELLAPIFYLGKENVEKQKRLEKLKAEVSVITTARGDLKKEVTKSCKAREEFCTNKAALIRETLRSAGKNNYNTYDKRRFITTADELLKLETTMLEQKRLAKGQKEVLRARKDAKRKELLPQPRFELPFLEKAIDTVAALLRRTVVSATIAELATNSQAAEWVKTGLSLHKGAGSQASLCWFCGQPLLGERVRVLEGHFNDQYERFLCDLTDAETTIKGFDRGLDFSGLPNKAMLSEHLAPSYETAVKRLHEEAEKVRECAQILLRALFDKRAAPFKNLDLTPYLTTTPLPDNTIMDFAKGEIAKAIVVHNAVTQNFTAVQERARRRLEEDYVVESLGDLVKLRAAVDDLAVKDKTLSDTLDGLSEDIKALEADSAGHDLPAKELNAELASYLGRDELRFEDKGKGYVVTRAGIVAQNLSEGEKTAIAFLYFLKSLKDKDFDLASSIVVIDDPISSLDANSIFSAFGFLRARACDAGQLFILTHNFTFFRQAKNWFHNIQKFDKPNKHEIRMYMLTACNKSGCRSALIEELDPLLREHETEYHYLFKSVAKKSLEDKPCSLEDNYGMPNVARRLLESFLTFRFPGIAGKLRDQIESVVNVDPGIRARIIRFIHTYSHDDRVAEPEHDLSVLAETPAVMHEILHLIWREDPRHYEEMTKLIKFDPLANKATEETAVRQDHPGA